VCEIERTKKVLCSTQNFLFFWFLFSSPSPKPHSKDHLNVDYSFLSPPNLQMSVSLSPCAWLVIAMGVCNTILVALFAFAIETSSLPARANYVTTAACVLLALVCTSVVAGCVAVFRRRRDAAIWFTVCGGILPVVLAVTLLLLPAGSSAYSVGETGMLVLILCGTHIAVGVPSIGAGVCFLRELGREKQEAAAATPSSAALESGVVPLLAE
jgi:hypothetical protein